ncbi:MAG TPA: tetratricopeptide repeat protein [Candidatus Sulfotelmatobacter sp.]|nr:tetratricopeptide repeat protein [Candidatus Sulfotelmatobacter sp.]
MSTVHARLSTWFKLASMLFLVCSAIAQTAPHPLRASEVMALEAGGAMQANIAYDISSRGLKFHPDEDFFALMKRAGADDNVLQALKSAKVEAATEAQPDSKLLQQLSDAAVLIKQKKYGDATTKLSDALDASFARMETGYAMAELLRHQDRFDVALNVYGEILETEPDFPEVHVKASYLLYRLQDSDNALNEAKAALAENPNNAEAFKNAGLALEEAQKFDAAIGQYKEALRVKPDYAAVHYDLGNLYYHTHAYDDAIAEYKKSLAIDPSDADAHTNLGLALKNKGNVTDAIPEFREAKRLNPNDPAIRQDLASALMTQAPGAAITELQELEKRFPDFEVCHICLGRALSWQGDTKSAEVEFRKANELDPTDPDGHRGLGSIQEQQKNYDAALEEYRQAEKIGPNNSEAHQDAGRVLLAKKDYAGAVEELKQAESLSQASWEAHELYAQALMGTGKTDLAVGEFKEALALNPSRAYLSTELAGALEKKGDWVSAMQQYRKAVLANANVRMKAQPGEAFEECGAECEKQYTAAQGRFADYLSSLKSSGRKDEAADLEKRVAQLDTGSGTLEKVQMALKTGDQAFQQRNIADAEKAYKEAVDLAKTLPPGDDNLIVAWGRLGNAYGMQQKFTEAAEAFHQQLALAEKTYGPNSERSVEPLRFLGQLAAWQKNYTEAEGYLQRALDINLKMSGDNDPRAVESLRAMAGFYESQSEWPKAETYLLRAVKGAEVASPGMVLIPLWGLCDLYDRWGKPDKSQPCWHRATEQMETQVGHDSPRLSESLTNEANALRKLGRAGDAEQLEERLVKIRRAAQN